MTGGGRASEFIHDDDYLMGEVVGEVWATEKVAGGKRQLDDEKKSCTPQHNKPVQVWKRRERERRAATNAFIQGQQLPVCCPTELPSSIIGIDWWSAGGGEADIAKPSDDESLKWKLASWWRPARFLMMDGPRRSTPSGNFSIQHSKSFTAQFLIKEKYVNPSITLPTV